MGIFLSIIAFLGTVIDWGTSLLGLLGFFGILSLKNLHNVNDVVMLMVALIISLLVVTIVFGTTYIWTELQARQEVLAPFKFTVLFFNVGALAYDLYTSFLGVCQFIILKKNSLDSLDFINAKVIFENISFEGVLIVLPLTILLTSSPILLDYTLKNSLDINKVAEQ